MRIDPRHGAVQFDHAAAGDGDIGVLARSEVDVAAAVNLRAGPFGDQPTEVDAEPQPFADRLRRVVPRSGSAILLIADAHDVAELLAVSGERTAVIRKPLTAEEASALEESLSAWPAASPGPTRRGEEATEASEGGRSQP